MQSRYLGALALIVLLTSSFVFGDEISEQVDAKGRVSEQLAKQTGWRVMRGVRYQILVLDEAGMPTAVHASARFQTGQRFHLEVESHLCDLWIYLLNVTPQGEMFVLYPDQAESHMLVRKNTTVRFPPGDERFRFVGPPGKEILRIIASPTRLSWVNPSELFELDSDGSVSAASVQVANVQKATRAKSVTRIKDEQKRIAVTTESLSELIHEMEARPQLRSRYKAASLVAPPPGGPGGGVTPPATQQATLANADATNVDPLIIDVSLEHGR